MKIFIYTLIRLDKELIVIDNNIMNFVKLKRFFITQEDFHTIKKYMKCTIPRNSTIE